MSNPVVDVEILPTSKPVDSKGVTTEHSILEAARGGGIVFSSRAITQILQVVFGILVARFLGAYSFGLYRLTTTVIDSLSTFSLLGFESGVVRYISIYKRRQDEERLWSVIQLALFLPGLVGLVLGVILFVLADQIAVQIFKDANLAPAFRLFSINLPLLTLVVVIASLAQGFKKVEIIYLRGIGGRVVNLIVVTIFLLAGFGLMGVLATQIISSIIALVFMLYFLHRIFPLNRALHFVKRDIKEVLGFSLPIYIAGVLREMGGKFETLILGFLGMTVQVGIFSVAGNITSLSNLFYRSLGMMASPLFAELHDRQANDQLKSIYHVTTKWSVAFNLPFLLSSIIFGQALLGIFGKEFEAGALCLVILSFGSFFNALTGQCGSLLNMIGESKWTAINSFVYLAATIVIDFALIPRWGLVGAAIAATLTSMLVNTLRVWEVYHYLKIWPFGIGILKPLAAAGVAGIVGYFVSYHLVIPIPQLLLVVLGISLMGSVYLLVIILLKLSPEDLLIVGKLEKLLRLQRR